MRSSGLRIAAGGRQIHERRDEHDEQRFDILVAASYELPCLRPRRGVVRLAAPDPTSPQFRSDCAALCACVSLCGYDRIGYVYDRSETARRVRFQCCLRRSLRSDAGPPFHICSAEQLAFRHSFGVGGQHVGIRRPTKRIARRIAAERAAFQPEYPLVYLYLLRATRTRVAPDN